MFFHKYVFICLTIITIEKVHGLDYSLFLKIASDQAMISEVISDILYKNFKVNALVKVVLNSNVEYLGLNYPVQVQSRYGTHKSYSYNKYNGYVIYEIDSHKFSMVIENLEKDDAWNPRAKFIIVCNCKGEEIYKFAYTHFMINIVILHNGIDNKITISTYNPYRNNGLELDLHINSVLHNTSDVFLNKLPNIWPNSTIIVDYIKFAPYVICIKCKPQGIELDLVELIAKIMKFRVEYFNVKHEPWGIKLPNASWTSGLGRLKSRRTDVAIGFQHLIFSDSVKEFDFLQPYIVDPAVWVIPRASFLPLWLNLVRTFQIDLWIWILVTLFITTVCWVLVFWSESETLIDVYKSIESPFKFLIEAAVSIEPSRPSTRIIFVAWWIFCFITLIVWKSNFVSFLTTVNFDRQVASLSEALSEGFGVYTTAEVANYFNMPEEGWIGAELFKRYKDCYHQEQCLNDTAFGRITITSSTILNINYIKTQFYIDDNGYDIVYITKQTFNSALITMFTSKGLPMQPQMDALVMQLIAAGFMDNIEKRFYHMLNLVTRKALKTTNTGYESLTLGHMKAPFMILIISLSSSIVVCVLEILIHKSHVK